MEINQSELPQNGRQEINLLDYLAVLVKWRRFLVINVALFTLLAIVLVLIVPRSYKSTASILPPKDQGVFNPLGAASSLLKGITSAQGPGSRLGQNPGVYNYLAILKSRGSMEEVVRKFNLVEVYDVPNKSVEKAIKELESNVNFDIQPEENITIETYDKDPQRAAAIANQFVEILNSISIRLGTQEGKNNREFIERRLATINRDLHAAEESLKTYQEKSGVLILPEQSNASVSAVAELYAMKVKKEIEVGILERGSTKDNPVLQHLKTELQEINKKVDMLPEAGIETLRLYREVAIQQKILEYVVPLYEQAKVDEQKNVPVILVLDNAVPAERPDKPKRVIIVLVVFILAFLIQAFLIFFFESFRSRASNVNVIEDKLNRAIVSIAKRYRVHL